MDPRSRRRIELDNGAQVLFEMRVNASMYFIVYCFIREFAASQDFLKIVGIHVFVSFVPLNAVLMEKEPMLVEIDNELMTYLTKVVSKTRERNLCPSRFLDPEQIDRIGAMFKGTNWYVIKRSSISGLHKESGHCLNEVMFKDDGKGGRNPWNNFLYNPIDESGRRVANPRWIIEPIHNRNLSFLCQVLF